MFIKKLKKMPNNLTIMAGSLHKGQFPFGSDYRMYKEINVSNDDGVSFFLWSQWSSRSF